MLEGGEEMDHELDLLLLRLPVSADHEMRASADARPSWQAGGASTLDLTCDIAEPDFAHGMMVRRWAVAGLVSLMMWGAVAAGVSGLL